MNWIHVSEGLPAFHVPVLLTNGRDSILVGERDRRRCPIHSGEKAWKWQACGVGGYEWEWEFDGFYGGDPVTHWMPLPNLPTTEKVKA